MHTEGMYDLWTVRLLSITLCVPPLCQSDVRNATSPNWLSLPIKMPRNGVRAIMDTGECASCHPHPRQVVTCFRTVFFVAFCRGHHFQRP